MLGLLGLQIHHLARGISMVAIQQAENRSIESKKSVVGETLADLPAHFVAFDLATPTEMIKGEFDRRIDLPGVIRIEGDSFYGVLSRDALLRRHDA
jgi:hypothetical protein